MREDSNICTFFYRIGACRHGDKCSKRHDRPAESKTILLANLYQNPKLKDDKPKKSNEQIEKEFEHFFTDVFKRISQIGEIQDMVVCVNENFHLNGNVYISFTRTWSASEAVMQLNQEWFGGRPVYCELLPVPNLQDANCSEYDTGRCARGENCNFMHIKRPSNELISTLSSAQDKYVAMKKLQFAYSDPTFGEEGATPKEAVQPNTTNGASEEPKKEAPKNPTEPESSQTPA